MKAFRETGASLLFPGRAHLLTTCKAGGGIPPVGRTRALFTKRLQDVSPEGAGNAFVPDGIRHHCLYGWQSACAAFALFSQIRCPYQYNLPPACENLPQIYTYLWARQIYRSYG